MPGILSMAQNGADSANARKLQEAQRGGAVSGAAHGKTNGDSGRPQLDGPSQTNGKPLTNGAALGEQPGHAATSPEEVPPLAHDDSNYAPFGELIGRITQDTNNTLGELIDRMAEIQVPGAPGINGVNGHAPTNGAGPSNPQNDEKKLMMLDWAWQAREKFIKLMVLSSWSRRAEEVVGLVDLNIFLNVQLGLHDNAAAAIGALKHNLQVFKHPNPDLKMALEVLSTGKAPWMPALDYIPTAPLSAQEMLDTLRNVNTMLSIRINLHEDLPKHLKNYSIADGRATFVIPGEFELSVSIADEEPTSPFFLVDVKFLFTPTPDLPDDFFRAEVEPHANHYLSTGGLTGCFEWLHNFVLTHKLSTLRVQAIEMSQEAWTGAIRIENFNRTLTVQYWADRPGPKSWIELGIATGKPKKGWTWRGPEPTRILLKWKRNGVLVEDVNVEMDLTNISMERILMAVIALHTSHILVSIRNRLAVSAYTSQGLSLKLETSKTEPADCALGVRIVGSSEPTEVRIEPVSGNVSLSPANTLSSRLEYDINNSKDVAADAAQRIEYQLCMHLKSYVERQAANSGWTSIGNLKLSRNAISAAVKRKVICNSFFRGQGWRANWVMAVTINLDGEFWWLMELTDLQAGTAIKDVVHMSLVTAARRRKPISPKLLQAAEKLAVAQVSFSTIRRELRARGIQHTVRHESADAIKTDDTSSQSQYLRLGLPTLFIKTSELVPASSGTSKQWATDYLRLYHHKFETKNSRVINVLRGEMFNDSLPAELVSSSANDDVSFTTKGTFAVTLRTHFGDSLLDKLINRLERIERLGSYMEVVKSRSLYCQHVSLSRLVFRYAAPGLTADISFREGAPVTLALAPSNPHRRVSALLAQTLNLHDRGAGFRVFVSLLGSTLPVLSAFQAAEAAANGEPSPYVHPRSLDNYKLAYDDPAITFDIAMRTRKDDFLWEIAEAKNPRHQQPQHPEFAAALGALMNGEGDGWRGVGKAVVARLEGVEDAIGRLDECVRTFKGRAPPMPQAGAGVAAPQAQMHAQMHGQGQAQGQGQGQGQGMQRQPLRPPPAQRQGASQGGPGPGQQRGMQQGPQRRPGPPGGGGGGGGGSGGSGGGPQPSEVITLD